MNFIFYYFLFLSKIITIFILFSIILCIFIFLFLRKSRDNSLIKIKNLNEQYNKIQQEMLFIRMNEIEKKQWKKNYEIKKKQNNYFLNSRPYLYVLDFVGDVNATEISSLRKEISAILSVIKEKDEVLLRLESSGGLVHNYGLASSQLQRIKNKGITLTIVVDKVAASGGYMMACIANRIVAAPFAIIGSIGVVAQIPNFFRLLRKYNIDVELHTAGVYKRTLTVFGKNSSEGRKKFKQELNSTHKLFKNFIHHMRPMLNINSVATGEHWYGKQAKNLGLIDEINTSDDLLIKYMDKFNVVKISFKKSKNLIDYFINIFVSNIIKNIMYYFQKTNFLFF